LVSERYREFVDELTGQPAVFEALREHELAPSSINTDGARRVMRRLCEEAEIDLDDTHGYISHCTVAVAVLVK